VLITYLSPRTCSGNHISITMDLQITTVAEAKSTFILGQVRDLSRPLEVPEGFADYAVDIPQKAIDTAMREGKVAVAT